MNLPNKLTTTRFFAVVLIIVCASVPATFAEHMLWWRAGYILAILGGFTDFFDGYLARRMNLVTDFGKLMDPLMDKIFTVTCFMVLTGQDICPFWVTAVIAMREFAVTGLRGLAGSRGIVIAASKPAKMKTMFQMFALAVGGAIWVDWLPSEWRSSAVWHVVLGALAAYTIYTGAEYYWKGRELYMRDV